MRTFGCIIIFVGIVLLMPILALGAKSISGDHFLLAENIPAKVTDPVNKNLVWNRWTNGKFVILSIDNEQGKYVQANIAQLRSWAANRWGFPDLVLDRECRIIIVPNKALMKKLFGISTSKAECMLDSTGKVRMYAAWVVFDDSFELCFAPSVMKLYLSAYERATNIKMGAWAHKGMSYLSKPVPNIAGGFRELGMLIEGDTKVLFSRGLLASDRATFDKYSGVNKSLFDVQSAVLCLMIRKEFGQQNFMRLAASKGTEDDLRKATGYTSYDAFDRAFKRYMIYLSNDIGNNRTPTQYLDIKPVYIMLTQR